MTIFFLPFYIGLQLCLLYKNIIFAFKVFVDKDVGSPHDAFSKTCSGTLQKKFTEKFIIRNFVTFKKLKTIMLWLIQYLLLHDFYFCLVPLKGVRSFTSVSIDVKKHVGIFVK